MLRMRVLVVNKTYFKGMEYGNQNPGVEIKFDGLGKRGQSKLRKIIIALICGLMILSGTALAAGDLTGNLIVIPDELTVKETIKITRPVKSADELTTIISNSLDNVCATLNVSVDNTKQWFTDKQLDKCINQAVKKSLIADLYYQGCKYHYLTDTNRFILNINFNYYFPRTTLIQYITTTEMKATEIINSIITPDMNDYQKELALHDYIVKNTKYDYVNYQNNTLPRESDLPYGILIKGTGVCEGFAQTMKLLLNKVGIECLVVSGTADGEPHSWNIVKIAGVYYQLDVTYDDPVGANRRLFHRYFNLNDTLIAVNHAWDRNCYPRCDATEYNYYKINDLLVENLEECQQRIQDTVNVKLDRISLMVLNFDPATFENDLSSLLTNLSFNGSYNYSYDKELGTVDIDFKYDESYRSKAVKNSAKLE